MADTETNEDQESKVTEETASVQGEQGSNAPADDHSENESTDDSRENDELPAWARKEIQKANREAASYRTQLREVEDQFKDAKTEAELESILKPLHEKLDKSEENSRRLERELVIHKHQLDEDLAEFITGDDPEVWEQQAAKLAERVNAQSPGSDTSRKHGLSGRNGRDAGSDVDPSEQAKRIVARNRF